MNKYSLLLLVSGVNVSQAQRNFKTDYLKIKITDEGFISSMVNVAKGGPSYHHEFSPKDHPSPLMSLLKKS
jgi:hypothetical protein